MVVGRMTAGGGRAPGGGVQLHGHAFGGAHCLIREEHTGQAVLEKVTKHVMLIHC